MGQRGQGILIWGTPAGTVMVVKRQVGHIWGRARPDLESNVCSTLEQLMAQPGQEARVWERLKEIFVFTYCRTGLQRCNSTAPRRWSCWRCVWCSRPSTGCWHIYGLLGDPKTLRRGGTTSQPRRNLRAEGTSVRQVLVLQRFYLLCSDGWNCQ